MRVAAIILVALSAPAFADNWTWPDIAREGVYDAVVIIDGQQTKDFANRGMYEQNPLLGKHPSNARVNTAVALSIVLHAVAANWFSPYNRELFQLASIGVEVVVVNHNKQLGARFSF